MNPSTTTAVPAVATPTPENSTITRTVGVEIECLTPRPTIAAPIRAAGGDLKHDSSIDGNGHGIEIVTKPIKGNDAEQTITKICAALLEQKAFVNASCGLHVHADASEVSLKTAIRFPRNSDTVASTERVLYVHTNFVRHYSNETQLRLQIADMVENAGLARAHGRFGPGYMLDVYGVQNLAVSANDGGRIIPVAEQSSYTTVFVNFDRVRSMRYVLFNAMRFLSVIDPVLRGLVPATRRHNTYCQPFEKIARNGGVCPNTLAEIFNGIGERYCGINLQALNRHGTIENRYHPASVNASKIIHWARLWERCVAFALSPHASEKADMLLGIVNGKDRLEVLCELLSLPESTRKHLKERHAAYAGSDRRSVLRTITQLKRNKVCVA